ncbi:hypothetical protein COW36_03420 [bacterium (Candidatus Blackallbacteria) CG17_big_fil_post_rev_8_21_14_2_50_48_46]|uniref:Uncharacterized protein n=1 Tax=bacterium (Candidatus Blackallbacteria) CG17_big_fil_post_rev_8_21_14_2_50_48_46 TaxID=2014261 RepID=A0A2M7G9N0_9BACT|nr:MAG: hypothetical protein COW64_25840 [bacterium (Candidatus Blackallbacteria) CG18_big_fil_WC_8_21_14_2_50_49_26]PIW18760.1 MAG: hypothetical protein COW36_03420 [bacterium (Candidatus Blackallbacteria) CG17_big_fil_post_rev_8_21_14_2_50_48_46]
MFKGKYRKNNPQGRISMWIVLMRIVLAFQCGILAPTTIFVPFPSHSFFPKLVTLLVIVAMVRYWWHPLTEDEHPRGTSITILRVILGPIPITLTVFSIAAAFESWVVSLAK